MILGIETSTAQGSIALLDDNGEIHETILSETRNHGRSLANEVSNLLQNRENEIEAFAISIGPGSFTGLRIGLAFLKGFGIVHDRPVVPVSSLRILAATRSSLIDEKGDDLLLPVFDARGKDVYAGLYRGVGAECRVTDELPDGLYNVQDLVDRFEALSVRALGDGVAAIKRSSNTQEIPEVWTHSLTRESHNSPAEFPQAATLVMLARDELRAGNVVDLDTLEPKYHQLSAAEKHRK